MRVAGRKTTGGIQKKNSSKEERERDWGEEEVCLLAGHGGRCGE